MAKAKITHNVCGRTFTTRRGLETHRNCEPIAPEVAPAPAPAEVDAERELIAELTRELMNEFDLGFVRANIRARKTVAAFDLA